MKPLAFFLLVSLLIISLITMITVIKINSEHIETITVYTPQDIYYLEGNIITSESGRYYLEFTSRTTAILALEDITATDANEFNNVPAVYH